MSNIQEKTEGSKIFHEYFLNIPNVSSTVAKVGVDHNSFFVEVGGVTVLDLNASSSGIGLVSNNVSITAGSTEQIIVGSIANDYVIYIKAWVNDGSLIASYTIEIVNREASLNMNTSRIGDDCNLTFDKNILGNDIRLSITADGGGSGVSFNYTISYLKKI